MEANSYIGKLDVTRRSERGKNVARKLRAKGLIPAVLYGGANENIPLSLDPKKLARALDPTKRQNTLLELTLTNEDGSGKEQSNAMLKEFQMHPLKDTLVHVDFVRVDATKTVRVSIPLRLEGKPEGVKTGGILHQVFRELEVECLPIDIPVELSVEVSHLNIGEGIQISDIAVPKGVTVTLPANQTCAQVVAPRAVVEEVPAEVAVEGAEGEEGKVVEEGKEGKEGGREGKEGGREGKGKSSAETKADKG
ncbi:MAG: 50S ribosomal protein L25 [Pseudomonadota bacterium]